MMAAGAVSWEADAIESCSDNELLAAARAGSNPAYGELWRRHTGAAMLVARRHRGRTSADDIVAAAATRVLGLLREGRGPEDNFRSYFLCTVRSVAVDCSRQEMREVPADDEQLEYALRPQSRPAADRDLGLDLDPELVHLAFTGLSESDQQLLWHTTVEGGAPRVVARRLGLSPNAVSVRAMRAREALRSRYLDSVAARWASRCDTEECRWVLEHLGGLVEGRLRAGQRRRVAAHVTTCPLSSRALDDLTSLHQQFGSFVGPLVLLAGLAAARLGEAGAATFAATGASATGTAATGTAATGTARPARQRRRRDRHGATGTAATGTAATGDGGDRHGGDRLGSDRNRGDQCRVRRRHRSRRGLVRSGHRGGHRRLGGDHRYRGRRHCLGGHRGERRHRRGLPVARRSAGGHCRSCRPCRPGLGGARGRGSRHVDAGCHGDGGACSWSRPRRGNSDGGSERGEHPCRCRSSRRRRRTLAQRTGPERTGQPACRSCHLLWLKRARTRG